MKLFATIFSALLLAPLFTQAAESDMPVYASKEAAFTIAYPKNWEVREKSAREKVSEAAVTIVAPKENETAFRPNVNVIAQDIPRETTLAQYADAASAGLDKIMKNYKLDARADATLGSLKAVRFAYSHSMFDQPLTVLAAVAVNNGTGYVITCTATTAQFEANKKVFDDIINSFAAK